MFNAFLLSLNRNSSVAAFVSGFIMWLGALTEALAIVFMVEGIGYALGISPQLVLFGVNDTRSAIVAAVCAVVVKVILTFVANTLGSRASLSIEHTVFKRLEPLYFAPHDSDGVTSEKLAMLSTEGTKNIGAYFSGYIPTFVGTMLAPFAALILLIPFNLWSGIILAVILLASPMILGMTHPKLMPTQMKRLALYSDLAQHYSESLEALPTLKVFNGDGRRQKAIDEKSEGFREATMDVLRGQLTSIMVSDVTSAVGIIGCCLPVLVLAFGSAQGMLTAACVVLIAVRLVQPERQLVYLSHSAGVAFRQARNLQEIEKAAGESGNAAEAGNATKGKTNSATAATPSTATISATSTSTSASTSTLLEPVTEVGQPIVAQNVSFAYPDGNVALENINVALQRPGMTAIVGSSGSGKSTFASLLAGELQGFSGTITAGESEWSSASAAAINASVTLVKGTDRLLSGTIRSNLDPSGSGIPDSTITESIAKVGLQDVVAEHGGLDAPVAAKGANFSGGERQRLIIARALLRDTPLYIFDEATSSVDRDYDAVLTTLMHDLSKTKTVLVVSHRLANAKPAGIIYVFDHGRLIESGDFTHLAVNGGYFAQQWAAQSRTEEVAR
ncbi:MAG: ATP-binding cassette domain-containing protein [Bifidobacteriaceae bacterium]|nr:ATP-binding cassette domain-containing protein [Bifidobacteriaceae bacterium]